MKNVVLKRACFIGIAVLFVLAIAACNAFLNPGNQVNEPVHFTEDGRPMVELTINTGANSRAMTQTLAQAAVDYYEVVFYDGTRYYRATWNAGQQGRILVPFGTYATGDKAIMFAGTMNDRTLLATGLLTATNDGSGSAIGPTTTSITFTLTALTSNVSFNTSTDTSTFLITNPDGSGSGNEGNVSYVTPTAGITQKVNIEGRDYPIFKVPADATTGTLNLKAEYSIGGLTAGTKAGVIMNPATGSFESKGLIATGYELVTLTSAAYAADGTAGIEKIIITMETPDVGSSGGGLCRLLVNIPVIAIDTGANGLTWYIRGGLNNLAPDGGKGTTAPSVVLPSTGGAIILGIGVTAMNIIVSGP